MPAVLFQVADGLYRVTNSPVTTIVEGTVTMTAEDIMSTKNGIKQMINREMMSES